MSLNSQRMKVASGVLHGSSELVRSQVSGTLRASSQGFEARAQGSRPDEALHVHMRFRVFL